MKHEEAFYVGYVTKTRGLKGEVQIFFEFDEYEQLTFDVMFADMNGKLVPYFVADAKLQANKTGYFNFDDVNHIDKAQPLLKKKLYLPLNLMPERDENEFFYTDLKGFTAVDKSLGELGEILEVNEYPQQFIATVLYQQTEILFPLNEDFIVEIDDEKKILTLDLPEGLLDIYLEN
ncbi:16S rRNA processing protein RimM [Pedobacter sp. Leaf41]|jgi:16S rRNA processing protein RimM|uniref:ribosome maturation factor RimM n=1 Tax=Pedobacter sp. Leaf41 TaxID=1736218 RepID=UPI0007027CD6|nr:ribosome maturation factor RimM [Pedobacter sp. Leaf41]KQN34401.1 16S rRNA processing protein RimM [Pedobacter sp. Leaf41]